jgi:hypothetical protein
MSTASHTFETSLLFPSVSQGRPEGGGGKWDNLPQASARQGPPTDRIFIPSIYYHLAGWCSFL